MAKTQALKMVVLGGNLPLAPKIDLVLSNDGLELSQDASEMVQSLARLPLALLGNSPFYPKRGVPWVPTRRSRALPVFTSTDDPEDLQRIESAIDRALARDSRVVSTSTTVSRADDRRGVKIHTKVLMFDSRLVELFL